MTFSSNLIDLNLQHRSILKADATTLRHTICPQPSSSATAAVGVEEGALRRDALGRDRRHPRGWGLERVLDLPPATRLATKLRIASKRSSSILLMIVMQSRLLNTIHVITVYRTFNKRASKILDTVRSGHEMQRTTVLPLRGHTASAAFHHAASHSGAGSGGVGDELHAHVERVHLAVVHDPGRRGQGAAAGADAKVRHRGRLDLECTEIGRD